MSSDFVPYSPSKFALDAEAITVRIRWFGVAVGFALVNLLGTDGAAEYAQRSVPVLNAILGIGVLYVTLDTFWSHRGKVFLSDWPLAVSLLEAFFIGLLCYFDLGQDSAFRFYYFLSLLVCAIRYSPEITYATFLFHATGYTILLLAVPTSSLVPWTIIVVSMGWVTWASTRLAGLARKASDRLRQVNEQLESTIQERTQELRESQAMLVQHEKQAAFGLLAAGIAHEVGNPLAAISSLVQILKRQTDDAQTTERYVMIGDQLRRIQGTLRELVDFSRPASSQESLCDVHQCVESALSIAKYYKRRKGKRILTRYAEGIPALRVVHDELVQVFLNLILNAMDATPEGGTIEIVTSLENGWVRVEVRDTGHGIDADHQKTIFEPYFTTKETGTGLGLFVCRQILERSTNGCIELTESSPAGTTFSVLVTGDTIVAQPDIPAPESALDHSLSVPETILPAPNKTDG
ncbi:MAG: sensor histidine kinase [Planctomycetota bacterium]